MQSRLDRRKRSCHSPNALSLNVSVLSGWFSAAAAARCWQPHSQYVGPAANFGMARKYAVAPGEHEIKLVEPRHEEITTKVTVVAGKTFQVRQSLKALPKPQPPFGRLRTISADKFAAVYVNGKFMGHADEFSNSAQGLLLNPGEYVVKIAPANGSAHEEKVKIEADRTVIVRGQ